MRSRRQRAAINQAEIRKRCKLMRPICEGFRAFREGILRHNNPYRGMNKQMHMKAWFQGWDLAQEK